MIREYKDLILGGVTILLVLGLYFYIGSLKQTITNLQSTLKDSYIELANYKLEVTRYKTVLDTQNSSIKQLKVKDTQYKEKLKAWESQPPKVKYKTIYKIREVRSNDCQKIKGIINSIRHTDFSSL